jgi:ribose/xylose/arabinose/galactoside ABC-type transport system permease subunit
MAVAGIGIQRVLGYTFVVSGLVCGIALLLLD